MVPTAIDVGLLVWLRLEVGLVLVLADLIAVAVASAISYGLHRLVTFRSDPFSRWVRFPGLFAVVAAAAAIVDAVVLRALFAAFGAETAVGLTVLKLGALAAAALVRNGGYRQLVTRQRTAARPPKPSEDPPPIRSPSAGPRLSVVLPAYREAERIGESVAAVRAAVASIDHEIIVVDDGSADGTAEAAIEAGADQVVIQPRNRGKGAAVRAGVEASRGQQVVFTDADLAYSPDHLVRVAEVLDQGWVVVIGNRRLAGSASVATSLRALGSRVVNLLATVVLLDAPRDTQCGLKGFQGDAGRQLFSTMSIDGFAFDIELLHLVERHELPLAEIPVVATDPGGSTVRVVRDVVAMSADLFRIRRRAARGGYELEPRRARDST